MKPIINPWFFYFINLVDNFIAAAVLILIFSLLLLVAAVISYFLDLGEENMFTKSRKTFLCIVIVTVAIVIFTPSSKVITEMVISSYITADNIDAVKEEAKDLVDYIVDAASEIEDGMEEKK